MILPRFIDCSLLAIEFQIYVDFEISTCTVFHGTYVYTVHMARAGTVVPCFTESCFALGCCECVRVIIYVSLLRVNSEYGMRVTTAVLYVQCIMFSF